MTACCCVNRYRVYSSHTQHFAQPVFADIITSPLIIAMFEIAEEAEAHDADATTSQWQDPLKKSAAFAQLTKLMEERIIYIDGAMGTSIQKHR